MLCNRCGQKISEGSKFCPECGAEIVVFKKKLIESPLPESYPTQDYVEKYTKFQNTAEDFARVYDLEGICRGTNCMTYKISSHIICSDAQVSVTTKVGWRKVKKENFKRRSIKNIYFKYCPVLKISYIISILIFTALLFVTYGFSILGVLVVVKCMHCRHLIISLNNDKKVKIPVKQDADAIPFLYELGWNEKNLKALEIKKKSDLVWTIKENAIFMIMWIIAFAGIAFGVQKSINNFDSSTEVFSDGEVKDTFKSSLDEGDDERASYDNIDYNEMIISKESSYLEVTATELARNPQSYNGQRVKVADNFIEIAGVIALSTEVGYMTVEYEGPAYDEAGNTVGQVLIGDEGYVEGTFVYEEHITYNESKIIGDRIVITNYEQSGTQTNTNKEVSLNSQTSGTSGTAEPQENSNEYTENPSTNFSVNYGGTDDANGYLFPQSSLFEFQGELVDAPVWIYQYGINEIYAKHGYTFNNSEVQALFDWKNWYVQSSIFSDEVFSYIERYNIGYFNNCIAASGQDAGLGIPSNSSAAENNYFSDEIEGTYQCNSTGVHIIFYHEMGGTYAFVEIPNVISKTVEVVNDVGYFDDGSVFFTIENLAEGQVYLTFPSYPELENWHEWIGI